MLTLRHRPIILFQQKHLRHLSQWINNADKYVTMKFNDISCTKQIEETRTLVQDHLLLYDNFINAEEEDSLMNEVNRSFRRSKYEYDHWDNAIHGFRETEKSRWFPENEKIIQRIKRVAFCNEDSTSLTHVLDLAGDGHIKPHVDSVKFCGSTIGGLSLLSPAIMRFVHNENKSIIVDLLMPKFSLYVMKESLRFDFTHEVLANEFSYWNGEHVPKDRRVSIVLRNNPG